MAAGFFGKVKNVLKKAGQNVAKVANFVIDKAAPIAAPIIKTLAPAANAIPVVGPAVAAAANTVADGLNMVAKHGKAFKPLLNAIGS
jgi:MinD superfamily P-loop ATPase